MSVISSSDYGSGHGDGYGYGFSDGSGTGHGSGYGYGFSDGSGDGSGLGDGYGYGFGIGDGSGHGGYGYEIGDEIAGHSVRWIIPWGVISVGCEIHTIAEWRAQWKNIADKNGVDISADDVEKILAAAARAIAAWPPCQ